MGHSGIIIIVLTGLCSALLAIASNIATSVLPESWKPYQWLAWPIVILLTIVGIGLSIWHLFFTKRSDEALAIAKADLNKRHRHRVLEKVRLFWIKGLLEPSLYHLASIKLGLETHPEAIERPFDLVVQRPEQAPQLLPPGTPISHIFDEGKALLILGEPGAGKTTLLLELARELLDRADQDEHHLIPVVFNLSSWAEKRLTLADLLTAERRLAFADWLINELNKRYDVPRTLAQRWIDEGLIISLLDGLDEVAADSRKACIEAINTFLNEHGLSPIVVCCRVADYEALRTRLRLPSAVLIQPLTQQQVQRHLEHGGEQLAGLRVMLQEEPKLGELMETPLMLSIGALAYQRRLPADRRKAGTLEERRTHLFARYTQAMFERRSAIAPYTQKQTIHWLSCLATAMPLGEVDPGEPERLLGDRLCRRAYMFEASLGALVVGLGLMLGMGMWLFIVPVASLTGLALGLYSLRTIDKFAEMYAELGEQMSDFIAEIRSDADASGLKRTDEVKEPLLIVVHAANRYVATPVAEDEAARADLAVLASDSISSPDKTTSNEPLEEVVGGGAQGANEIEEKWWGKIGIWLAIVGFGAAIALYPALLTWLVIKLGGGPVAVAIGMVGGWISVLMISMRIASSFSGKTTSNEPLEEVVGGGAQGANEIEEKWWGKIGVCLVSVGLDLVSALYFALLTWLVIKLGGGPVAVAIGMVGGWIIAALVVRSAELLKLVNSLLPLFPGRVLVLYPALLAWLVIKLGGGPVAVAIGMVGGWTASKFLDMGGRVVTKATAPIVVPGFIFMLRVPVKALGVLLLGRLGWMSGRGLGLLLGLFSMLLVGLGVWRGVELLSGLRILSGLAEALIGILILIKGEITSGTGPIENMWQSLHIALLSGLVVYLTVSLFCFSLCVALLILLGLLVSLLFIGMLLEFTDLKDWVPRYLLWRHDYFPWHYERFLNYATERNFLRKVGNRYTFVHRMLLEYFAAREHTCGEQQS